MVLRWPADFPEDCPPEEAQTANGVYYYIVKSDPPELADFASLYHRNRKLALRRVRNGIVTECQTMGLSIFIERSDAVARARQYTGIGDKIAQLTLGADAGEILSTPRDGDSHHTWWKAKDYDPVAAAAVVLNL